MHANRIVAALLAACALHAAAACDRRIEPFDPEEKPAPPDIARIFRPEQDPLPELAAGVPAPRPGPRAGPDATGAAGGDAGPPAPITGTIRLAPELAGRVPADAVLFLIALRGTAGPPLAVVKLTSPSFPLEFEIGPDDRMIETLPFEGPVLLSARLDADGEPLTRAPGDLQGRAPGEMLPGATGVILTIDEAI
jgi:hypothetical protein